MLPLPRRCSIIVDDNTIRERRDRQEERPPTKRQRVESDDEDGPAQTASTSQNRWVPQACPAAATDSIETEFVELDPIYNTESSFSIIVRVQNTLFKIHRKVLDCSEILRIGLEEHEKRHGSTTELRPLRLIAPTVEEFRALLWLLHAQINEIQQKPSSDEHLSRLFNIAAMTVKYDLPKVSVWVSETILEVAKCSSVLDACSSATLSRFVDVAVSRKNHSTLALVVHQWCKRLLDNSAPSVPAIQTADKHEGLQSDDMRELRGIAYYVHVQDMLDRQTEQSGATHLRTDSKLNNGQVMRLLAGYWSLVTLWERMRINPIRLPQAPGCSEEQHDKCCATWSRRWISAAGWKRILDHSSADILALLGTLRDQLSNDDDLRSEMHMECRNWGLHEIRKLVDSTRAGLADHFVGCL